MESYFIQYFLPIVFVFCLMAGYAIKHWKIFNKVPNQYIPEILGCVGAIVAIVSSTSQGVPVTFDEIVYGAFTGFASTGFHQALKAFIKKQDDSADPMDSIC